MECCARCPTRRSATLIGPAYNIYRPVSSLLSTRSGTVRSRPGNRQAEAGMRPPPQTSVCRVFADDRSDVLPAGAHAVQFGRVDIAVLVGEQVDERIGKAHTRQGPQTARSRDGHCQRAAAALSLDHIGGHLSRLDRQPRFPRPARRGPQTPRAQRPLGRRLDDIRPRRALLPYACHTLAIRLPYVCWQAQITQDQLHRPPSPRPGQIPARAPSRFRQPTRPPAVRTRKAGSWPRRNDSDLRLPRSARMRSSIRISVAFSRIPGTSATTRSAP